MADGRANNGNKGHSTRVKRLDDKRLSIGRKLINEYIKDHVTPEKLATVLNKMYEIAEKGDKHAASLYLSYIVGKPKESLDLTSGEEPIQSGFNLKGLSDEELAIVLKLHERRDTNPDV